MARTRKKKQKKVPWTPRQRSLAGAVIGLSLGVWGAMTVYGVVTQYQVELAQAQVEPTVEVLVAARDLPVGMRIKERDLVRVALPEHLFVEGMVTHPAQILGEVPKEPMLADEPFRKERLAVPEEGIGLNAVVPFGMRALSVEIADAQALGGHLTPGTFVDVTLTYLPDNDTEQIVTRTVAQALFVLAVNADPVELTPQQEREVRKTPRPSVTFLVDPEQAKELTFAEQVGTLSLTLRNQLDSAYAHTTGVSMDSLLAHYDGAPVKLQ